ncbi:hypothetical protein DXG03_003857 [Asterophora parasitica]|uniref:Uncharacterized protein n=1 Tax=Asterophora parasitica TaxID=117018 RepID=A0A9P7G745_9AGAR|nr:hypothetical protein DXG03_003857 [Asterophora parasitica]
MQETLQELSAAASLSSKEPAALADVQREFVGTNLKNIVSFGAGVAYEFLWKKAEGKAVYLGKNVVDDIVQKFKDEVKSSGTGFVSTGDVLVAWFLKAAYLRETDKNAVCVTTLVSIRSLLEEKDLTFKNYTHNSIIHCSRPSLSKQEIASKSLAELAVMNRKAIDDVRNIPFIQAYTHWVAKIGGNAVPTRRRGADSWLFSNQVIGHFDEIDFGSEMSAFWHWNEPSVPDHSVTLNKFKGGYIIEAGIRRSRWEAVAEEVERMKKDNESLFFEWSPMYVQRKVLSDFELINTLYVPHPEGNDQDLYDPLQTAIRIRVGLTCPYLIPTDDKAEAIKYPSPATPIVVLSTSPPSSSISTHNPKFAVYSPPLESS